MSPPEVSAVTDDPGDNDQPSTTEAVKVVESSGMETDKVVAVESSAMETDKVVESSEMETEKVVEVESSVTEEAKVESSVKEVDTANMDESGEAKAPDVDVSSRPAERDPSLNHSNRRVIIMNVYKFLDRRRIEKMADVWFKAIDEKAEGGLKMEIDKVKKPPRETWTVLTLKDEAMVQPLIDYINDNGITNQKGSKLFAKRSEDNSSNDGDDRKRKAGDSNDDRAKRQRPARRAVTEDEVRDAVTPLWRKTKEEQLVIKTREMVQKCAMKIVKEIKGRFRALEKERNREKQVVYDWVLQRRSIDTAEIISAPTPLRNKCEFTFGYHYLFKDTDKEGTDVEADPPKIPAVGFMATGWAGGVSSPNCCENIPTEACAIGDIVNGFLSNSPLVPYDSKLHNGFWRTLTIRSSRRTMECMVIIMHAPTVGKDGIDNSEHFETEKTRLLSLLTAAELPVEDQQPPLKVTSIFFQEYDGLSAPSPEHPVQHAYGKEVLLERLGKCTFQISPGAFFQVNTAGAELLYAIVVEKVREVSPNPEDTLLFDVCCGTGTIGLTCMKEGAVGSVIGVDISAPAIEDAKANAELNGFGSSGDSNKKTHFVAARAEKVLGREIGKAKGSGKKFVAVVDPARDGLHADVVKTLRQNELISRIVYVSCNPTATLVRDAALFCGPPTKRYPGGAFRVSSAAPVDMFPLTNHCEMVMVFDRIVFDAQGKEVKSNGEDVKKSTGEEVKSTGEEVKSTGEEVKPNGEEVKPNGEEVKSTGEEVKSTGEEVKSTGEEVKSNEAE